MSDRPKAGDPPDLTQPTEVMRYLLGVECRRLEVALGIEAKREIVFPETTVIIRDIERLTAEIERRDAESATPAAGAAANRAQTIPSAGWAPADLPELAP